MPLRKGYIFIIFIIFLRSFGFPGIAANPLSEISSAEELSFEKSTNSYSLSFQNLKTYPETCQNNGRVEFNLQDQVAPAFYKIVKVNGPVIRDWTSIGHVKVTEGGLGSGDYEVWAYDGNSNQEAPVKRAFRIEDQRQIVVNPDVHNIKCYGDQFGKIRFTVPRMASGGNNIRVRYRREGGQFFNERTVGLGNGVSEFIENEEVSHKTTDFPAGTYIFQVRQGGGGSNCYLEFPIVIHGPESPLQAEVSTNFEACQGNTATVQPIGGWGNYSYLWSNGQTGQTVGGLSPGTHTVRVRDTEGCEIIQQFTVTDQGGVFVDFEVTDPSCNTSDGKILIQNTNLSLDRHELEWWKNNPETGELILTDASEITHLPAGKYFLVMRERNDYDCIRTWEFSLENKGTEVTVLEIDRPVICEGEAAELLPTVDPAYGQVEYRWYRDASKNDPVIDNSTIEYDDGTAQVIHAIEANGRLEVRGLATRVIPYEYYVEVIGENVCESREGELKAVYVTVNPKPSSPIVNVAGGIMRHTN
jgi:hypothetical protein